MLPESGQYDVKVSAEGRTLTGLLVRPKSWQWALERAREGALKIIKRQHPILRVGMVSTLRSLQPDTKLDAKLSQRFDYLYTLLHDTVSVEPKYYKSRIQNTSGTIGMLVDKYEAYGNIADLRRASQLADWLVTTTSARMEPTSIITLYIQV